MNKPYFFVFPFVMKINYSASQSMRVWTAQICLIKRLFSSLLILYICFRSMMIINKKNNDSVGLEASRVTHGNLKSLQIIFSEMS